MWMHTAVQNIMNPYAYSRAKSLTVIFLIFILYFTGWYLRSERFGSFTAMPGFGCVQESVCFTELNSNLIPENYYAFPEGGYDGQFYYYAAASMFSDIYAVYDDRDLRLSRIGYPLLSGWMYPLFGAEALVIWMSLLLIAAHLAVAGFLLFVGRVNGDSLLPALLFAFNPFSFLSFLLNVSDGLALSFSVAGILFLRMYHDSRGEAFKKLFLLLSYLFITYSILTKETFLAVPAGMLAGEFILYAFRLKEKQRAVSFFRRCFFWAMTVLPLAVWWIMIDYDIVSTSSHGGIPFSGIYGLVSQGVLRDPMRMSLFSILVVSGFYFFRGIFVSYSDSRDGDFGLRLSGIAACILILIADMNEYWGNFANIARLFSPIAVPLVFIFQDRKTERFLYGGIFIAYCFIVLRLLGENL